MNRRSLHQDLLHSGKYRQQIVKAKKGKGAFSRHDKHKKHRHEQGGVSFWGCGRNWSRVPFVVDAVASRFLLPDPRPLRREDIAIHRKPHTVLRRFAVQPRTVFSGAPCLKLSVDGYKSDL